MGDCQVTIFGKDEDAIKRFGASMPLPEIQGGSFNQPKPLHLSKVAIVTTAALHPIGKQGFELGDGDSHYEILSSHARDFSLGHYSVNFDRGGFAADINVVYPIDRLHELAEERIIGEVAANHYSFAGNQSETVSEIRLDSGPNCAKQLLKEGVDIILLTGT